MEVDLPLGICNSESNTFTLRVIEIFWSGILKGGERIIGFLSMVSQVVKCFHMQPWADSGREAEIFKLCTWQKVLFAHCRATFSLFSKDTYRLTGVMHVCAIMLIMWVANQMIDFFLDKNNINEEKRKQTEMLGIFHKSEWKVFWKLNINAKLRLTVNEWCIHTYICIVLYIYIYIHSILFTF